jgi:cell division septation protein DedD
MAGGPTRLRGRRGTGGGALAVFVAACLAVLALTFLLGVLVGRQWAHRASADSARVAGAPASPGARSRARRLSEREAEEPASQIQEKLTFYQTLTAPLTAGPPPAAQRTHAEPARGAPAPASAPPRPGAVGDQGYTIQVAAFRSRAQADKLRETLGGEAYVAEIGAGRGAPFRVRVGSFASRAEAEARAVRLRTELSLGAFVTQK